MNAAHSLGDIVRLRAKLLASVRRFFDARDFLEVETPLLAGEAIPEAHIDLFEVPTPDGPQWLQASPEAHMKRLLVALTGESNDIATQHRIYQIARSFRRGEVGPLHLPEFTILEWYRTGDDMAAGMELLDQFMREVADAPPTVRTSYGSAFQQYVGIDPHTSDMEELAAVAQRNDIECNSMIRDEVLDALLVKCVEPQLGETAPAILYDYPASQSSLARLRTDADGTQLAERFELYWRGIELANGFHEETDADKLQSRFEEVFASRIAAGKPHCNLPERFLTAMQRGLPPCAGVALGFDRLAMLLAGADSIRELMQ